MNIQMSKYYLHVEAKKLKLTETETRIVVTRGLGVEEWGNMGQRV